ncbi:MAG: anthranilate phosphoribosyltransferase [Saprospiraceae bacterium]
MKHILEKLYAHHHLSRAEARDILTGIAESRYNDAQIASFITVFLMRAISTEELEGFRDALLDLCLRIDLGGTPAVDIVGTGGDGKNTFNISTLAAFTVAGAGYKVAKHGNYGVSSACGSSNVLEHLGYRFTADADVLRRQLDAAGICFFHAPFFHPAMRTVAPIRRQLGVKTFFNMLGPLVNPAQPRCSLLGVFSRELGRQYHYLLEKSGREFAIVHALDGYDEVSLTGPFQLRSAGGERLFVPQDLGKKQVAAADLFGGNTVEEAATIFQKILAGAGSEAQNDVVAANAGLAIQCLCPEKSLADCMGEAAESLASGRAGECFRKLVGMQYYF